MEVGGGILSRVGYYSVVTRLMVDGGSQDVVTEFMSNEQCAREVPSMDCRDHGFRSFPSIRGYVIIQSHFEVDDCLDASLVLGASLDGLNTATVLFIRSPECSPITALRFS